MSNSASDDSVVGSIYATFWRMIYMGVNRYASYPTGELLVVMTIVLLDMAGYKPTISDLVDITGLNKSNVSRYVSRQIKNGFMTDVINPQDRRRRRYCPTPKGKNEAEWHQSRTLEIARLSSEALHSVSKSKDPVSDLKKILLDIA